MSSDLKVTNIKHESSGSNNLVLASDGNVSITNTLSAGTIGDNVNLSNKYYLNLKLTNNYSGTSGGHYINTQGTSNPYFTLTGDTTNLLPANTSDIKVIRKGIYLINFSGTFLFGSTSVSRAIIVYIRGGTSSNPTTVLAASVDQIASTANANDHGNASCSFVGELPANYFLRFQMEGVQADETEFTDSSHATIALIRPTA